MREFFLGWRRKAGCVTLLMACALMGAWARSQYISDSYFCWTDKSTHYQYSSLGRFSWKSEFRTVSIDPRTINSASGTWRTFTGPKRPKHDDRLTKIGLHWIWSWGDFEFSKKEVIGITTYYLTVPYLPPAFSLPLLSAGLILWKPRKNVTTSDTQEAPHA